MTVKENTIYFILQLPQMKTTFVYKSQKVNLQGNIYSPHPTLPFYFLFTFYLHIFFFDDMIIKGTKGRTYLYVIESNIYDSKKKKNSACIEILFLDYAYYYYFSFFLFCIVVQKTSKLVSVWQAAL